MRPVEETVARPSGRTLPRSIVETIMTRAESGPGAPLLRFTDDRGREEPFDVVRLRDDALRAAGAMARAGVDPGDRVLLLLPENHETVRAFLGAIFLGALPAICPPGGDREGAPSAAVRRLVEERRFRLVRELPEGAEPLRLAALRLPAGSDPAYIQLSSGTTGPPKGVVLTHGAIVRYGDSASRALGLRPNDMFVGWPPLFHDMGLITHFLVPILTGTPSVHISTARWLRHPETLFQAVDRHRGTMTWMPNFAFAYCTKRVRDEDLAGLDLSCWRSVGNGSEPIVPAVMDAFAERFAPVGFRREALVTGYGFAENVCGVTLTPAGGPLRVDRSGPRALVSCGAPRPGVEVRVVDGAGRDLPDRTVGRILVRSTTLFDGYLDAPEETRASFEDGWFRSGDMGYMAEGELYVTGREKDLVIVGGRNLHPEAIEAAAAAVPGVGGGRVVAFGVPDEAGATEAAVLVCETKNGQGGHEAARRAIRDAVLAETGVGLADVRIVAKGWIAKTTSGKTVRAACRRRYLDERAAAPAHVTGDLEAEVTRLLKERLGVSAPATEDLCAVADSLQLASLFLEIEELAGRRLPWEAFLSEPTPHHLFRILRAEEVDSDPDGAALPPTRRHQSLRRRLHRLRKRLRAGVIRAVPYDPGVRLLRWSARSPRVRARLFRREIVLLRRFHAAIEPPGREEAEFVPHALAVTLGRKLRETRLARVHAGRLPPWVEVRGLSFLQEELAKERGVVLLHSHMGAVSDAVAVGSWVAGRGHMSVRKREIERRSARAGRAQAGLVSQILEARRTLAGGGTVDIAGDGYQGESAEVEFPFHGRRRPFRAGFAHLAESTGAAVLPVFAAVDESGRITVELYPPIEAHGATPEERIHHRIASYVHLLEERWRRDPANVLLPAMRKFLALPPL